MAQDPMAAQQGAPAPAEGGAAEGQQQMADLVSNLGTGMQMLVEVVGAVSPELGQKAQQLMAGFEELVGALEGSGAPQQGAPQPAAPETRGAAAQPVR